MNRIAGKSSVARRVLWAWWLAMGVATGCVAGEFHVAPDGDDANPGTADQPFRTIRKALDVVGPGDVCRVRGGTYHDALRPPRSGKFDQPIRFLAATGETVIVSVEERAGEGEMDPRPRPWGINLGGRSLIEVTGFRIDGGGINLDEASFCRVERCQVNLDERRGAAQAAGQGDDRAIIRIGGKENEVIRCQVVGGEGNGVVLRPGSVNNRVVGVSVRRLRQGTGLIVAGTAQTVRSCSVAEGSGEALWCDSLFNGRILNNDLQCSRRRGERYPVARITGDGKGTIVAYNWMHDDAGEGGDGVTIEGPAENYLLHHNVIWGHGGAAIRLRAKVQYCLIFNNTCVRNRLGLDSEGMPAGQRLKGLRFFNNLFTDPVWPANDGQAPEGVAWECNFVGKAPGFADGERPPFTLRADSPCVDAGQDEPELTDTFGGRGPDIGASEFGAVPAIPGPRETDEPND